MRRRNSERSEKVLGISVMSNALLPPVAWYFIWKAFWMEGPLLVPVASRDAGG